MQRRTGEIAYMLSMNSFPLNRRRRAGCSFSGDDRDTMKAMTIGKVILKEPRRKMSSSLSEFFDTKISKKTTEIQQGFQSSSAPISSKYVGDYSGILSSVNDDQSEENVLRSSSPVPQPQQARTKTQDSVKAERGTDSSVTETPGWPKLSTEKRSENTQQQQQREAAASSLAKEVTFSNSNNSNISLTGDALADKVVSSSANLKADKLIRPQPIKSAPSGAELPLAALVANFSSSEKTSRLLSSKSPVLKTNASRTNTSEELWKEKASTEKKKAGFVEASEKSRKERELRRAREKAEIRRLQKLQCDFPETQSSSSLTPRKMSGREYNDRKMAHTAGDDYNIEQQLPLDNLPQVSNRISLRSPDPRRASDGDHDQHVTPPTPLFERLVTEEVHELKAYARILESQNRRLSQLERVHGDLEARLHVESQGRQQLEATLEAREREWAKQLEQLESDRNHWRHLVQVEETKNMRLMEEVMRKEQEIRRMLQRKVCLN